MKKFCLILGLIAALISITPAFAAPPPHKEGGQVITTNHYHGHRQPVPPSRHYHKYNSGFTVYTGFSRPIFYDYYDYYYRPVRYFSPINTGIYIRF